MIKILDFYADWCVPCKAMDKTLGDLKERVNVEVEKIDVEDFVEIADEWNIRSIPTIVVFKDNELLFRHTGSISLDDLLERINSDE